MKDIKIIEEEIQFAGERLVLTNQRAIFWPQEGMLILSDLHLGKASHFRKFGIAMPIQVQEQDLTRLEQLIVHYNARTVLVVGDLLHAGENAEVSLFKDLTDHFSQVRFLLVRGNHDRIAAARLRLLGIQDTHEVITVGPICFSHHDIPNNNQPTISGHLHPGVTIRMPTKGLLRFPCFAVTQQQLILPAFSSFTGLDTIGLPKEAVCYACYPDGIFDVAVGSR